ncbi:sulfatase-like hydrolase/transferase [Candidatus Fermentibacteria bacterium]|nr:sulfatase-like hydrolase/transferase [Candidatus Fermentibacteria bacterium]
MASLHEPRYQVEPTSARGEVGCDGSGETAKSRKEVAAAFSLSAGGALAAVLALLLLLSGCRGRKRNVVLIIVDTVRADHLGCYGYPRDTSPHIDSLAAVGTLWSNVYAQSSWTLPATTTILTGLSERSHRVGMKVSAGEVYGMNEQMPTLATILGSRNYRTAAFFNVYLMSRQFNFDRGFQSFECHDNGHGRAGVTVDQALGWLEEARSDQPFFLAVHLFDPHDPYAPPAPFDTLYAPEGIAGDSVWEFTPEGGLARPSQKEHLMNLYDGEIAWTDGQLGRLFAGLREMGLAESTIVALTADHGEEFLEHGYVGHGRTLYGETVNVPLVLSGPGVPAGRVDSSAASQLDVLPTVLGLLDAGLPDHAEGFDLLAGEVTRSRPIPASGVNTGPPFELASLVMDGRKVLWYPEADTCVAYDLMSDPLEQNPVEADPELQQAVLRYWATPPVFQPVRLESMEVGPALRDLGYI